MFQNNCNNSQMCQNSAPVDGFLIQLTDNHKMHNNNPVGSNLYNFFIILSIFNIDEFIYHTSK